MAYQKKKHCEKKGKFRAKYVGPYTIAEADEAQHKFWLVPLQPKTEAISYTNINILEREVSYIPTSSSVSS